MKRIQRTKRITGRPRIRKKVGGGLKNSKRRIRKKVGRGLINSAINNLPIELHYPGYQFLGPGTKLESRLKRNDKGVNPLDEAAREHDIFYQEHKETEERHKADKDLQDKAWNRVVSSDARFNERVAALVTTGAMKLNRLFRAGCLSNPKKKKKSPRKRKSKQKENNNRTVKNNRAKKKKKNKKTNAITLI